MPNNNFESYNWSFHMPKFGILLKLQTICQKIYYSEYYKHYNNYH